MFMIKHFRDDKLRNLLIEDLATSNRFLESFHLPLEKSRLLNLKMPAGVGWGPYLRFVAASFLSMVAGAQIVHYVYRPLDSFNEYVNSEMKKRGIKKAESS